MELVELDDNNTTSLNTLNTDKRALDVKGL
jgi:hypothetical protein